MELNDLWAYLLEIAGSSATDAFRSIQSSLKTKVISRDNLLEVKSSLQGMDSSKLTAMDEMILERMLGALQFIL